MDIVRPHPPGAARPFRAGTLLTVILLLSLAAAVLVLPRTATAGRLSGSGGKFTETFPGHELDGRYWTVLTTGGVQTTVSNGLTVDVPAEPSDALFYSHTEAVDGFAVKPESDFLLRFQLAYEKWPTPRNGVSAGLYLDVKRKGSRQASLYQISFVRESDNVSGKEIYRVSGWDMSVSPSEYFVKEVETDAPESRFTITREKKQLVFRAVTNPENPGDPVLSYKMATGGHKFGRTTWGLWVSGQTAYFKHQPVSVACYSFSVSSQKGFELPAP